MSLYLIPVILVGTLIYAIVKKVAVYDCFIDGAKESLALVKSIFPYLAVIFIAIELFRASGLSALLSKGLSYPSDTSAYRPKSPSSSCWSPCRATVRLPCSKT